MVDYHLDEPAFREHILNAPWMLAEMRSRAEAGLAFAVATAPEQSGHYKESLSVDSGTNGGIHHDRAEAVLSSSDNAALSIEFGHAAPDGSHVDGHYTLTQARDVMGA